MATCKECLHIAVCGRYAATGGHVRECGNFATDNNVGNILESQRKKIADLEKSNRNWRRKIQKIRQRYAKKDAKWIPVSERLPEESGSYLVATKNGGVMITHYYMRNKSFSSARMNALITHWMTRPEPPKGE